MLSGWEDKRTTENWTEDQETENETKFFSYIVLMFNIANHNLIFNLSFTFYAEIWLRVEHSANRNLNWSVYAVSTVLTKGMTKKMCTTVDAN